MKTRLFLDFDTVDVVSALDERRNPSSDATVHIQCVLFHRVEVFAASDFGVFVILVLRGLNLYEEILERNESFGAAVPVNRNCAVGAGVLSTDTTSMNKNATKRDILRPSILQAKT